MALHPRLLSVAALILAAVAVVVLLVSAESAPSAWKEERLVGKAVEEQVVIGGLDSDVAQVTYADLGPDGDVWILDAMNSRVRQYVAVSGLEAEWGRRGEGPAELTQPAVLKVSPTGDMP